MKTSELGFHVERARHKLIHELTDETMNNYYTRIMAIKLLVASTRWWKLRCKRLRALLARERREIARFTNSIIPEDIDMITHDMILLMKMNTLLNDL